jgi:hypothetical protein
MNKLKNIKRSDIIVTTLILFITYFYFMLSDIEEGIEKIDLYFFEIGSFGFPDFAHLIYYAKMKLLIICFALIWYFTCKHWWKSVILVVIAIELSKLITALFNNEYGIDEIDYITSLPITLPIILSLVIISNKINKFNLSLDLRSKIDDEIDVVFFDLYEQKNNDLLKLEDRYNDIKNNKSTYNAQIYLEKLIMIRKEFYKI